MIIQKLQISFYCILLTLLAIDTYAQKDNKLTKKEREEGWELLFDGRTTDGWRGTYRENIPENRWVVKKGVLAGELTNTSDTGEVGDIITVNTYQNFELLFDWKLGRGGNSGLKYFIEERQPKPNRGAVIGYEYQLIDDVNFIYNGKHLPQNIKTGSLYEIIPADKPDAKINVWHTSKIVVNNNHIEHWLNGKKIVDTDRNSDKFQKGLQSSKFKTYSDYATIPGGHILLQDHGHNVEFKNIKIKQIK